MAKQTLPSLATLRLTVKRHMLMLVRARLV